MNEVKLLTQNDLKSFKVDRNESIILIKHYSCQYNGKVHYEKLGASCGMSVNGTVNTIIGSAKYLEGMFLMPDEIQVERLAEWFIKK